MTGSYRKCMNQWFMRYEHVKCYGIITEGMVISTGDFGEIKEEFMKLKHWMWILMDEMDCASRNNWSSFFIIHSCGQMQGENLSGTGYNSNKKCVTQNAQNPQKPNART